MAATVSEANYSGKSSRCSAKKTVMSFEVAVAGGSDWCARRANQILAGSPARQYEVRCEVTA